uniref:Uncharacterized protein n=1 Tax=Romanomermis culicivorax TaxID=13658 RepID=A0A915HL31_ROMCU
MARKNNLQICCSLNEWNVSTPPLRHRRFGASHFVAISSILSHSLTAENAIYDVVVDDVMIPSRQREGTKKRKEHLMGSPVIHKYKTTPIDHMSALSLYNLNKLKFEHTGCFN